MLDNQRPLLVDRVTRLQEPSDQQVAQWAHYQSVFISSTMTDLVKARQTVRDVISRLGARPIMFETFGARSDDSRQAYLGEVRRSSIYLGLLSRRYGVRSPSGYSATQEEYEEARRERKETLLFLDSSVPDSEREGHLNQWLKELHQVHAVGFFNGVHELSEQVRTSLVNLAGNQFTPWVKLDHLVFQATRLVKRTGSQGTKVEITTACQEARIRAELAGMGRERFGKPGRRLTYVRESLPVQVDNVEETIDSVGSQALVLVCSATDDRYVSAGGFGSFGTNWSYQSPTKTYPHSELVGIALRAIALGEEPPPDPMLRTTLPTNFHALYQACGGDTTVFPRVAQLAMVERALAEGVVASVLYAFVGNVRRGQAQITVSALLPQFYSNVEPEVVELIGAIQVP